MINNKYSLPENQLKNNEYIIYYIDAVFMWEFKWLDYGHYTEWHDKEYSKDYEGYHFWEL